MASGTIKEIPVSAVASQKNNSGFSAIKHKQAKRVVTVYSALSPGETDAALVVGKIQNEMKNFKNECLKLHFHLFSLCFFAESASANGLKM